MTAANITRTHRKEQRPVALCAKRTCCPRSLFFCNQALQRSATPLGAQAASLLILSFRAQRSAVEESLAILSLKNKRCLEHARHDSASGDKARFPHRDPGAPTAQRFLSSLCPDMQRRAGYTLPDTVTGGTL